jgi:hypothetical protein
MKTLIVILSILLPATLFAQRQSTLLSSEPRMNEIGIMLGNQSMSDEFTLNTIGVQYKHWVNEYLGWRAMAGYANYQSKNLQSTYRYTPDTIFSKQVKDRINMPTISLGLEAQRRFYKRVYMYAALDLQAAYGKGNADTILTKKYATPGENRISFNDVTLHAQNKDVNMFFLGFTPTVGAKVNLNKLSIGLEISALQATFRHPDRTNIKASMSAIDLSFGSIVQRCFITYRF